MPGTRIDIELVTVAVRPRLGGMTAWFEKLAWGLFNRGWRVRLVAIADRIEGFEDAAFDVVHIETPPPEKDRLPLYGKWRRWYRAESEWERRSLDPPGLRITDGTPGILRFANRLAHRSGVPWVVVMGGDVFAETGGGPMSFFVHPPIRRALQVADGVVVDGHDLRQVLVGRGVPAEKIHLHYQGVDLETFGCRDSPTQFFPDRSIAPAFRAVWHGRLGEHHGPSRFLEIAGLIPETVGRLAGAGILSRELEQQLKEKRFRDWYVGCLPVRDLAGLLDEADVGIYPLEKMTGVPTVLLESMAAGNPTLTFRTGACEELIEDGKNGFVVEGIAEMVACANRLRIDTSLRMEVGYAAKETIRKKWSVDACLDRLEKYLQEFLSR